MPTSLSPAVQLPTQPTEQPMEPSTAVGHVNIEMPPVAQRTSSPAYRSSNWGLSCIDGPSAWNVAGGLVITGLWTLGTYYAGVALQDHPQLHGAASAAILVPMGMGAVCGLGCSFIGGTGGALAGIVVGFVGGSFFGIIPGTVYEVIKCEQDKDNEYLACLAQNITGQVCHNDRVKCYQSN